MIGVAQVDLMQDSDSAYMTSDQQIDEELRIFDFSHHPVPNKRKNIIRCFYNNVNGLEINAAVESIVNGAKQKEKHKILKEIETHTKLESCIKQMQAWNVDICTLSEPCIEWRDTIPRKIVQEISRKYDQYSSWTVASSKCYSSSFVKPGGALVYCNSTVTGRIIERGTDPWDYGRWAFTKYGGKDGTSLLVICGYRVGHRTYIPGASTAWYQQKVLLTAEKRDIDPEEAFLIDMEAWLSTKIDDKTEILFFLDANEQ